MALSAMYIKNNVVEGIWRPQNAKHYYNQLALVHPFLNICILPSLSLHDWFQQNNMFQNLIIPQMLHVWYIFAYIYHKSQPFM